MLMPSPNTFRKFWDLGYRRLLPIAPPDAPVPHDSRLTRSRGKSPAILCDDGLWRSMRGWRDRQTTLDDLDEWNSWHAGVGIALGPQTVDGTFYGHLLAIDADTLDDRLAHNVWQTIQDVVGFATPLRVGRKPKALYLIRTMQPLPYACVKFQGHGGKLERVELLTEGKQFVAFGIHPQTNSPYQWPNGIPALKDVPTVADGEVNALFARLATVLPAGQVDDGSLPADRAKVDQARLRGDPDLVREAMARLPNTDALFGNYDDWIRVGQALHAATADDPALGEELWLQWCARYEFRENDDEQDIRFWRSFKAPHSIGAEYLYDLAERHGKWDGKVHAYFSPVNDNELDVFSPPPSGGNDLYEVLTLEDILALPDPRYVVDRHFPEQSLGFLYGEPGTFKSFIAFDLCMHLAHGLPDWHGDTIDPTTAGLVVYLAGEGAAGFKHRAQAWLDKHLVPEFNDKRFILIRKPCNFMSEEDIARLERTVAFHAASRPVATIVVDTVSRAVAGADQNLQKDMTIFIRACDRLKDRFKAVVLGVHHTNKGGDILGSVVFRASGDFVFRADARKGSGQPTVRLTCEKQKDGPDGWGETYAMEAVGQSLVPRRLTKSEAVKVMSAGKAGGILEALDSAWREGKPWKQRGVDSAVTIMMRQFGMARTEAEKTLQTWLSSGTVTYAVLDKKTKLSGYRLSTPAQDAGVFD